MKNLLLTLALTFPTHLLFANSEIVEVDMKKSVVITGMIRDLSNQSNKLLELAKPFQSGELPNKEIYGKAYNQPVIDILLDSPGGMVFAGNVFLNAMHIAQGRGYKLRCIVPVYAASMAFIIFAYCDERVALPNSLLLFHPMSRGYTGRIDEAELKRLLLQMDLLNDDIDSYLKEVMGMDAQTYAHFNNQQLYFTAAQLAKKARSGFISIPKVINGVDKLFNLSGKGNFKRTNTPKFERK